MGKNRTAPTVAWSGRTDGRRGRTDVPPGPLRCAACGRPVTVRYGLRFPDWGEYRCACGHGAFLRRTAIPPGTPELWVSSPRVILGWLRRLGAQVSLEDDRVQVHLPAGVALPEALQAALQARREAVVAFLRRQENRERRLLLAWERAFRRVPPHPPADHPALRRALRLLQAWARQAVRDA